MKPVEIRQIDPQREKDIAEVLKQIVNMGAKIYYNPNGADDSTCPFCYERVYNDNGDMNEISHKQDCAFLIAKDLLTGLL